MASIPTVALNDGVDIPQLGFGTFQIPPDDTEAIVTQALEAGYRHIDTAAAYRNERGVGNAIVKAGLAPDEVFVTTKLWNTQQGRQSAKDGFEKSMERLGLDVLDLYLIHWPAPEQSRFVETWEAFVELKETGRIRSIGVSNFRPQDLDAIIEATGVTPSTNQIELHPAFQQRELRDKHEALGIATESWSPLGQGAAVKDPVIGEIAEAYGKTPAQVILRWHLEIGCIVIPKSVTPERITENFDVTGFELGDNDRQRIAALDAGTRLGPDPSSFA